MQLWPGLHHRLCWVWGERCTSYGNARHIAKNKYRLKIGMFLASLKILQTNVLQKIIKNCFSSKNSLGCIATRRGGAYNTSSNISFLYLKHDGTGATK